MLENISALSTIRFLTILLMMILSTIRSISILTTMKILTILSTHKTKLLEIILKKSLKKIICFINKVEGQDRVKVEVVGKFG